MLLSYPPNPLKIGRPIGGDKHVYSVLLEISLLNTSGDIMRISNPLKLAGYFWLPSTPDHKVPGTLTIADGGDIELEVISDLDLDVKKYFGQLSFPYIYGAVEDLGSVTIESCFYLQRRSTYGVTLIARSRLRGSRVLAGNHFADDELEGFNGLRFGIEGLDEWLDTTGFTITYQDDFRAASIEYAPPELLSIALPDGFTLSFVFSYTLPEIPAIREASIKQSVFIQLSHEEEQAIEAFTTIAHRLTLLLGFAMNETVALHSLALSGQRWLKENDSDKSQALSFPLFYPSRPYSAALPTLDRFNFLFRFRDVNEQIGSLLGRWLSGYDAISPSLSLYFSMCNDNHPYLAGQFLSLAQGLETYSRQTTTMSRFPQQEFDRVVQGLLDACEPPYRAWLSERLSHGNEPSLRNRLKELIKPFAVLLGSPGERRALVGLIVDTRNYLTHYDDALRSRAASGEQLYGLLQTTEALFQLHILSILGFSSKEIEGVVGRCERLQLKLCSLKRV